MPMPQNRDLNVLFAHVAYEFEAPFAARSDFGRMRLPTCVVRMRRSLRFIALIPVRCSNDRMM